MEQVINLIIPFIALAMISVMIDKFTLFLEQVVHAIPRLPDKFEWWIAYFIVLLLSTVVCWQGDFRFFDYLNLYFPTWLDYFMTGLVISGGSAFVRTQFGMIESIPSAVMGVTATFRRFLPSSKEKLKQNQDQTHNNNYANYGGYNNYYTPSQSYYESTTPVEDYLSNNYPPALDENVEEIVDYNDTNRFTDDI